MDTPLSPQEVPPAPIEPPISTPDPAPAPPMPATPVPEPAPTIPPQPVAAPVSPESPVLPMPPQAPVQPVANPATPLTAPQVPAQNKRALFIILGVVAALIIAVIIGLIIHNKRGTTVTTAADDATQQVGQLAASEELQGYGDAILPLFEKGQVEAIKNLLNSTYAERHSGEDATAYVQSVVDAIANATPESGSVTSVASQGTEQSGPVIAYHKYYDTPSNGRVILELALDKYDGEPKIADLSIKQATGPSDAVQLP